MDIHTVTEPLKPSDRIVIENRTSVEHRSTKRLVVSYLKDNLQVTLGFIGIVLGFIVGFSLRPANLSPAQLEWIVLPGVLFLRMIMLTVLPLITSSVIIGTSQMKPAANGKVGICLLLIILCNSLVAVSVGLLASIIIEPGKGIGTTSLSESEEFSRLGTADILMDMIRNLVPENIIRLTIQKSQSQYNVIGNKTDMILNKEIVFIDSMNILGLVVVSAVFGLALSQVGQRGDALVAFFQSLLNVTMVIINWFMWISPIGIASLICAAVAPIDDIETTFRKLGLFVLTVSLGLLLIMLIYLPTLLAVLARRNLFKIYPRMLKSAMIAFATTTSVSAMPEMVSVCDSCSLDRRITGLGVSVTLTVSACGSCVFSAASCLFLAQVGNTELDVTSIIVIGFLVLALNLALPSVPSASIVIIVIILSTVGFPTEHFGILFAVEWFLDRYRTSVNMLAHLTTIIATDKVCRKAIQEPAEL